MLLLDTHAWIWCVDGSNRLGRRAQRAIGAAEAAGELRVSPVSVFEVAALHTEGRLRLALPVEQWIAEATDGIGIRLSELTRGVAVDAGMIPRAALPDPMDRLLIANARGLGARLLTADDKILDYATDSHAVLVQNASR